MTPNRKLLMQSTTDPARWEALEILANDPTNFYRTDLDTAGAEHYGREGGFSIVPSRDYNAALSEVSEARRAKSAPPPTPQEFSIPRNAAESVALLRQQGGYEGVGPAMMAELGDDRAALAGHSLRERDMPMDPELARRIERERQRDAAGSDLSRRVAAERVRDTSPTSNPRSRQDPRITVGTPGESGEARAPVALRPPTSLRTASEQSEGVVVRTTSPASGPSVDEEMAAAQKAERDHLRGLAILRAASGFSETLSGAKANEGAFDALEKSGGGLVRDLLARREAQKRRELDDPTSEQSRRLQAYVSKALPGVYTEEEISQMTAGDADAVTRYGEMRQRFDQRAADRAAMQTQRADDISREDRIRADEQTFRATEAQKDRDLQRELARRRGGAGGPSAAQTAAARNRLETDIQKAGEDLEGAGTLASDLDFLDKMSARDDIPGVGRWDSKKTGVLSFLASDDDTRTMQTMRSVVGRLLKERSGTAASDAEVERVMTELGMGPDATEQQFRVGVKRLRQDVGNALATKQARYRPEVVQTYRERGGKTAQDIAPRAAGRQVEMIAPDGTSGFVDAAEVAEAEANGYRRKA